MERVIRLNQIWSWLPAFRAVAETEHVHEAALLVHLTPSTLSRAIHLLEDDLGCALFRRVGRSLELTDEGRELLHALRDAMRGLDDAVVAVTQRATAPLRVAADDAVAMVALVGALAGAAGAPELSAADGDVTARLLRGAIDVALPAMAPSPSTPRSTARRSTSSTRARTPSRASACAATAASRRRRRPRACRRSPPV
jgi:DNA-binding transcriptional LysR family regulator